MFNNRLSQDTARKTVPEKHKPGLLAASAAHGHARILPFEDEVGTSPTIPQLLRTFR